MGSSQFPMKRWSPIVLHWNLGVFMIQPWWRDYGGSNAVRSKLNYKGNLDDVTSSSLPEHSLQEPWTSM
jgi:hypothetical protein